jgi:hypothetical protein
MKMCELKTIHFLAEADRIRLHAGGRGVLFTATTVFGSPTDFQKVGLVADTLACRSSRRAFRDRERAIRLF